MLQKGNYLKLETRYVKTVFTNGIYDKLCIRMGVFWIFDKIEENRYFSEAFHLKENCNECNDLLSPGKVEMNITYETRCYG